MLAKRALPALISLITAVMVAGAPPAHASPATCAHAGAVKSVAGQQFVCKPSGGALRWSKATAASTRAYVPPSAAVQKISQGQCEALMPAGWTMTTDERSQVADTFSSDRKSWAAWGMAAVNPAMQPYASAYGVEPGFYSKVPAEQAMATLRIAATNLGYAKDFVAVGPTASDGVYHATEVRSGNARGFLMWADPGFPGDGVNYAYISSFRGTLAPASTSDVDFMRQVRNMLSIRCATQVKLSSPPFSASAKPAAGSSGKTGSSDGYNAQLDTFWGHDPQTGQNYSLTNADLVSTGCGTGNTVAVVQKGNSCVELAPGRA